MKTIITATVTLLSMMFFVSSCSSPEKITETYRSPETSLQYINFIKRFTDSHVKYKGLVQQFDIHATILNSRVIHATTERQAGLMQWDSNQIATETEEQLKEYHSSTNFLVFIYTPERSYNDLDKKDRSIWRTYLNYGETRYAGSAKKSSLNSLTLKTLYPHITRFHKAYLVTFDIPMSVVEKSSNILTLVSPLGTIGLKYKGIPNPAYQ